KNDGRPGKNDAVRAPAAAVTLATSSLAQGGRVQRVAALRHMLSKLERSAHVGPVPSSSLLLGSCEPDRHFSGPGLSCGVLHEVSGETHRDQPSAFAFVAALMGFAQQRRPGPTVFIIARRALVDFGSPYGQGLRQLGLDTGRLLLIQVDRDK